jgi:predicted dehydrogenase
VVSDFVRRYIPGMINLAFLGVAHIHTPGFIKAIEKRPDLRIKSIWDPARVKADARAKQVGATVVEDFNIICSDPEISAVIICSETGLHEKLALPAVAAKKNIFIEKPLGFSTADADRMAAAIEKAGVIYQTGYFRRGDAAHIFLKQQIAAGAFGKITHVRASNCHSGSLGGWFDSKPTDPANDWRWMADPKLAGCGAFGDLGTHMLDILIWLLGDVASVTARTDLGTGRYGNCDELGEALFQFKSGTIATLAAGWTDVADPVSLMINGTEGNAYVLNHVLYFQSKHVEGADGKSPWTKLPSKLNAGFDAFLDALEGKMLETMVTAKEAAYRSKVMGAMYDAAAAKKWIEL